MLQKVIDPAITENSLPGNSLTPYLHDSTVVLIIVTFHELGEREKTEGLLFSSCLGKVTDNLGRLY